MSTRTPRPRAPLAPTMQRPATAATHAPTRAPAWPALASGLLLAGGVSWLAKIGVIVATGGRVITTGPAALLMSAGLLLLALGAAAGGAWLARRAHPVMRAAAAVAAVGALAVGSGALGWLGATLFQGRGPAYLAEEAGLLAAAVAWSAVGAAALARTRRVGGAGRAIA